VGELFTTLYEDRSYAVHHGRFTSEEAEAEVNARLGNGYNAVAEALRTSIRE
jgi:hypothetical protein